MPARLCEGAWLAVRARAKLELKSSTRSEQAPAFMHAPPRSPGLWKLFVLSKKFKWNQARYYYLAKVQKKAAQSHYKALSLEKAQRNTHWNMTIRANSPYRWANHSGKCNVALGSLIIPAAIQGQGLLHVMAWDTPLLLLYLRPMLLTGCFKSAHTTSSALGYAWWKTGSSTAILTAESERKQLISTMTGHPFLSPGLRGAQPASCVLINPTQIPIRPCIPVHKTPIAPHSTLKFHPLCL